MKKVRNLPGVGVEYEGDLGALTQEELREFGQAIPRDNVVLVRNQDLHESDILRVCEAFGNVYKPDQFFMHPDYPGLFRVTNERRDGEKIGIFADKELDWHSNGNGRETGVQACVALYCVRPGIGSVTSFLDTRQAYRDLPDEVREVVDDTDAIFKFENNTFYHLEEDDKELQMFQQAAEFLDGVEKPLTYTHPWTGERGLYWPHHYIRLMYSRTGRTLDTEWLWDCLMAHVFQDKYIYHHDDWRSGDFIFMDQFHSIHRRNAVEGDRFLYRLAFDYAGIFR